MKYSFIIPCKDRYRALNNCIMSIEKAKIYAKHTDAEIVVIFNGGGNSKEGLKREDTQMISFNNIDATNASAARNHGIRVSKGEYLIFIDDDAAIREDYIDTLNYYVAKYNVHAFYGKILDQNSKLPFVAIYRNNKMKYLNYYDYSHSGGTSLVLKRDAIDKIGMYDEIFGPGGKYYAAEETDLYFRLLRGRYKIIYLPDLIIYHPIQEDGPAIKVFRYSYSIGAVIAKNILSDKKHFLTYLVILNIIIIKSFVRSLQNVIFPMTLKNENKRYKYSSVLIGTIRGFADYINNEILRKQKSHE